MSEPDYFDVLVIGSGAAGLTCALRAAEYSRVAVLSKGPLDAGSTSWAQGGIAAVVDDADSFDSHVTDTLRAGAGLCEEDAVRFVVERAPKAIDWLLSEGVQFTTESGEQLHLTQEGGHSHRRIIHAADATGRAVQASLEEKVKAHPNITVLSDRIAVDAVLDRGRCIGMYVLNIAEDRVEAVGAKVTVLATGGASKVYLYTSNPDGSTGDGIAIAWRAGCRVADMEFNQFHPTCLYHPKAKSFLISEAVRGEGGILRLPDGTRFMPGFDDRAELAPRDIVARAIDHEMKRLGLECVYLDITHKPADFIRAHFPTIHARCLDYGIDMTKEPIPVVPAAHYTCGGVMTDLNGRTDVQGLYAIGETASTGLHGANRMASNSLLECFVFGASAAEDIAGTLQRTKPPGVLAPWDESRVTDSDEDVVVSQNWAELRRSMWSYVGIVRTDKRLERAAHRISLLKEEIDEYYGHFRVTSDLLELRNLVVVGDLIVRSARLRKESRGLHYTLDYPGTLGEARHSVLVPPRKRRSKPRLSAMNG